MAEHFRLFPIKGSQNAGAVDLIYVGMVGVTVFFTLLIAGLIIWFMIRYRCTATVNRRMNHSQLIHWSIEIGWMAIPLAILLVAFSVGAAVYIEEHQPPEDPIEISVIGKQWMWKVAHQTGKREINTLHLPANRAVRLRMTSEDVIHSFYIPAFRNKQDVLPGRYTAMWFVPTRLGKYHLFCAEYCGTDHSKMRGEIVVLDPEEYAAWSTVDVEPPDQAGRRLLETLGCNQCHRDTTSGIAPSLDGLYGAEVLLGDGRRVTADDNYIRRSIMNPHADVVAGYKKVMPPFAGSIEPEEIDQIISYLKSVRVQGDVEPEEAR